VENRRQLTKIAYYPYAFDKAGSPPEEHHLDAIYKMLEGRNHSVNREKIGSVAGFNIFSVRYGQKGRMLITNANIAGQDYWIILEDLPNHEYNQNDTFNSMRLKKILEDFGNAKLNEVMEKEKAETYVEFDKQSKPTKLYFHDQKFIELNNNQQQAFDSPLPFVVYGPPGSGKSLVLWEYATKQHMQKHNVLYVAHNPYLVEMVKDYRDDSLSELSDAQCDMQILTYHELVKACVPDIAGRVLTGEREFNDWFASYTNKRRTDKILNELAKRKEEVYEELRNLSGYEVLRNLDSYDKNIYMNLGERECLFSSSDAKNKLIEILKSYNTHLENSNDKRIDLNFYKFKVGNAYKGYKVFLDELGDCSTLQILLIVEIVGLDNIAIGYDSHQNLFDQISKRPFLNKLFGQKLAYKLLEESPRNASEIIDEMNKELELKYRITGGKSEKSEQSRFAASSHQKSKGVNKLCGTSDADVQALRRQYAPTSVAVITHDEFIAEAKQKFPGSPVYSIIESKGLEFPYVIRYKPFGLPIYKEANKIAGADSSSSSTVKANNLPKSGRDDRRFRPCMNKVLVAASRAMEHLITLQDPAGVANLLDALKPKNTDAPRVDVSLVDDQPAVTLSQDVLLMQAIDLWRMGKFEQSNIVAAQLDKNKVEILERKKIKISERQQHRREIEFAKKEAKANSKLIESHRSVSSSSSSASYLLSAPSIDDQLMKKFTQKNLLNFFNRDDSSERLYNDKSNNSPLIYRILTNLQCRDIFFATIKKYPTFFHKLLTQNFYNSYTRANGHRFSAFELFLLNEEGCGALLAGYKADPSRIEDISEHQIFRMRQKKSAIAEQTPFNTMLIFDNGLELVSMIFGKNKSLLAAIKPDFLITSVKRGNISHSSLFILSKMNNYSPCQWILDELFIKQEGFSQRFIDDYLQFASSSEDKVERYDILVGMLITRLQNGESVFQHLKSIRSDLLLRIAEGRDLFARRDQKRSPFYLLCQTVDMLPDLYELFEEHPDLIAKIDIQDVFQPFSPPTDECDANNLLVGLLIQDVGIKIAAAIIYRREDIRFKFSQPEEIGKKFYNKKANEQAFTFNIFQLIHSKTCDSTARLIMNLVVGCNPELTPLSMLKHWNDRDWNLAYPHLSNPELEHLESACCNFSDEKLRELFEKEDADDLLFRWTKNRTSYFHKLIRQPGAIQMLGKLFHAHPELAKKVSIIELFANNQSNGEEYNNYFLRIYQDKSSNNDSLLLLNAILDAHGYELSYLLNLISHASSRILLLSVVAENKRYIKDIYENHNNIMVSGKPIISYICQVYPLIMIKLLEGISLHSHSTAEQLIFHNPSNLYWLMKESSMHQVLFKYIKRKNSLIDKFVPKLMVLPFSNTYESGDENAPLLWLVQTPYGRKLLKLIIDKLSGSVEFFSQEKYLIEMMFTIPDLCTSDCAHQFKGQSVLRILNMCKEGEDKDVVVYIMNKLSTAQRLAQFQSVYTANHSVSTSSSSGSPSPGDSNKEFRPGR